MLDSGCGIKPRGTENSGSTNSYISLVNNLWLGYELDDQGFESGMDNRLTSPQIVQTGSEVNSAPYVYLWFFAGVKVTRREEIHLQLAQFKNVSCTRLHGEYRKHYPFFSLSQ